MKKNRAASLLALGLCSALAVVPAFSQAADAPAAKPPAAKPPAGSGGARDRDLAERCADLMNRDYGMMGGGMMGGGMMGGGMMESPRLHMVMALNLSDEQRAAINKLGDELRHKNWEREGAIQDEAARLRDLYEADKRDPTAIGAEYKKIFDLKREMIEAMVDTQNRIEALLTPDQLRQLKDMRRMRGGMGHPMMHP